MADTDLTTALLALSAAREALAKAERIVEEAAACLEIKHAARELCREPVSFVQHAKRREMRRRNIPVRGGDDAA